jgi:hypothetical protein
VCADLRASIGDFHVIRDSSEGGKSWVNNENQIIDSRLQAEISCFSARHFLSRPLHFTPGN